MAQLHRLRWQIGGAGMLLLVGGFVASQFVARRFAIPVQKLALDSEEDRAQRKRAEAALAAKSARQNFDVDAARAMFNKMIGEPSPRMTT